MKRVHSIWASYVSQEQDPDSYIKIAWLILWMNVVCINDQKNAGWKRAMIYVKVSQIATFNLNECPCSAKKLLIYRCHVAAKYSLQKKTI